MTNELPTNPLTHSTENMYVIDDSSVNEQFHRPIIGTAMTVMANAHSTITQISRSDWLSEYIHEG